ncbi:hypothetical protein [uncultured Thiodictyon sp.]|uniref:restriction endonuclease subunit S n=1 Tax=uncultured Thiodictyon sp. TaxID=1846217 RepID=UPI0025D47DBD|nr:hypothetical protein [uncultured Thiodictyon sp.]
MARRIEPISRDEVSLEQLNVIAKISFGGALHLRTAEDKRNYKGPLLLARPGDLIISKIRVAQGSLCIVPSDLEHLAVSPEYPVYGLDDTQIVSEFLRLMVSSAPFKSRVSALRSGNTSKARIKPSDFEALTIPLPSLADQDALVAAYMDAIERAATLEKEAEKIESAGLHGFEEALGMLPPPPLPDRPLFIARFKDLDQWSHEGILRASLPPTIGGTVWPMVALGSVGTIAYGIQKWSGNRPGTFARPYLRVANVQRGTLDLREIKFIEVSDADLPKVLLKVGDLLLCEGNSAELVGRAAIWRGEIRDCVHQNHILRVRLDQDVMLPEFVLAVINSRHGQSYFRSKAKQTTNLASINSREVAALSVPLLPIAEQKSLLLLLDASHLSAEQKRSEAAKLRQSARTTFEAALFEPF